MKMWLAVVKTVVTLRVPQNLGNFLAVLETPSFIRRSLIRGVSKAEDGRFQHVGIT